MKNGDEFVTLLWLHCVVAVFSQSAAERRSTYQKNVVQYCHKMTQLFHDSSVLSSFTVLMLDILFVFTLTFFRSAWLIYDYKLLVEYEYDK